MTAQSAETEQVVMDDSTCTADVLALAAAPTFAIMALLTAVLGSGQTDMICSAAHAGLSGMIPMYLLMSAFHSGPWLRLMLRRRRGGRSG